MQYVCAFAMYIVHVETFVQYYAHYIRQHFVVYCIV